MKQSNIFRILSVLLVIYVVSFFGLKAMAQSEGTDVVIGQSLNLTSKILNREVSVLIYVPEDYNTSSTNYAVLYDLNSFLFTYDSGTVELLARTSDIPNMIVVGVPPLERGYVPTPFEDREENPAGADLSIKFLKEELIPFVEKNYRTNTFRILYGHSVGGLFTMYTLFNYPDLFTAYVAGSPWFQTNDQYWLKNIEKMAKERKLDDKFLFMTVGKEEAELTIDTYQELEKWINDKSIAGLTWKSAWVEGDHGSMVGRNIYDGLIFIFSGWKMPFRYYLLFLVPMGVDGLLQLVGLHESNWVLRTVTGAIFGIGSVLFAYPYLDEGMRDVSRSINQRRNLEGLYSEE